MKLLLVSQFALAASNGARPVSPVVPVPRLDVGRSSPRGGSRAGGRVGIADEFNGMWSGGQDDTGDKMASAQAVEQETSLKRSMWSYSNSSSLARMNPNHPETQVVHSH